MKNIEDKLDDLIYRFKVLIISNNLVFVTLLLVILFFIIRHIVYFDFNILDIVLTIFWIYTLINLIWIKIIGVK